MRHVSSPVAERVFGTRIHLALFWSHCLQPIRLDPEVLSCLILLSKQFQNGADSIARTQTEFTIANDHTADMVSFEEFDQYFSFALKVCGLSVATALGIANRTRLAKLLWKVSEGTATNIERVEARAGVEDGQIPLAAVSTTANAIEPNHPDSAGNLRQLFEQETV